MMKISPRTTGWVVMETVRAYGVDAVFGIPGTHNLELYRPLVSLGIRPVTTRHEQGAGYAADGWSLQTGKPGVVITTSGPGLLNALTAAATAYCESRPMLIIAPGPARGRDFADIGVLHETKDQLGAASAVVEWGRRVQTAEQAVEAVHDAFELFGTGRPRPVYLEIPLDLLEEEAPVSTEILVPRRPSRVVPDEELARKAAELLRNARNPVLLAGGGARGASTEIRLLAERLGAPIVTTLNGKGVVDEAHPLALGSNLRFAEIRRLVRMADVLLVVGSKLGEAEIWVDRLDAGGMVIQVDVAASQLGKNQDIAVGVIGDARDVLSAINNALSETTDQEPFDVSDVVKTTLTHARNESFALSPANASLAEHITAALPSEAIVATDSSQIAYYGLLNALRVSRPNSTLYMGTYATLGYGLPAAIGAKIGTPDRPVFAVVGDGALMFSLQELMTAIEQRLDLTVLVVDNGGYAEIRDNEIDADIEPVGVDLVQPNWPALACSFGGEGHTARDGRELAEAVAAAIRRGGLQLIHLPQINFVQSGEQDA